MCFLSVGPNLKKAVGCGGIWLRKKENCKQMYNQTPIRFSDFVEGDPQPTPHTHSHPHTHTHRHSTPPPPSDHWGCAKQPPGGRGGHRPPPGHP